MTIKTCIGKLGGYAISIIALVWTAGTLGPKLVDSAQDWKVVSGAVLYISFAIAIVMIGIDAYKTIMKMGEKK